MRFVSDASKNKWNDGIANYEEFDLLAQNYLLHDPNYNTDGRIGDVTKRPDERDLNEIKGRVTGLLHRLKYKLPPLEG